MYCLSERTFRVVELGFLCFLVPSERFHSLFSISPFTQQRDQEHFSFPAPANPPLQRIRSTSTPNVHMVSTTAPMDSSLMQVGVKEVTVGSMEHCLEPLLLPYPHFDFCSHLLPVYCSELQHRW